MCSSNALAGDGASTASLSLDAPDGCASFQELSAGVARRSSRIRLLASGASGPSLRASLKVGPDGTVVAELVVTHESGRRTLRRLSAPSCLEAVDALALVIAITLDPASVSDASAAAASSAAGTSIASDGPAAGGDNGARASAGGIEKQSPVAAADEPRSAANVAPAPAPVAEPVFHFSAGVAVGALLGPAPELMPGLALAAGGSWDRGSSPWSPALRLFLTHYWLHGVAEADGDADFEIDSASVDACPLRIGGDGFAARPCAALELGRLLARGSATFAPQSHSRPFGVLGGSLWLESLLFERLEASLALSAGKTLVLDEFAFTPTTFHRVSAVSAGAKLGLSLRFR